MKKKVGDFQPGDIVVNRMTSRTGHSDITWLIISKKLANTSATYICLCTSSYDASCGTSETSFIKTDFSGIADHDGIVDDLYYDLK